MSGGPEGSTGQSSGGPLDNSHGEVLSHQRIITDNRVWLVENIDVMASPILDQLAQDKILSQTQLESLKQNNTTNYLRVSALLDFLYKRPEQDWEIFKTCLSKHHHHHVVQKIDSDSRPEVDFDLHSIQVKLARDFIRTFTDLDLWTWQDVALRGNMKDRYVPLTMCYHNKEKKTQREFEAYLDMFQKLDNDGPPLRIVVRGEQGSGKTTLVKKIVYDWCCLQLNKDTEGLEHVAPVLQQYQIILPILLRHVSPGDSLQYTLSEQLPCLKEQEILAIISLVENSPEKILFLCDGFDELPEGNKSQVEKIIKGVHMSDVCCVTTTRAAAFSRLGQDTRSVQCEFELLGLTKGQSETFVRKSFGNGVNMANALLNHIMPNEIFCHLARSPILLQVMCYVWEEEGKLKRTECELYTSFVEVILGRYEEKKEGVSQRGHSDSILKKHQHFLIRLGKLACYRTENDGLKYVFSHQEVWDVIGEDDNKIGFLKKCYPSSRSKPVFWTFLHRSLQEYMAAYYVSQTKDQDVLPFLGSSSFFRIQIQEDEWFVIARWHSILHFLCGLSADIANQIITQVIQKGQLEYAVNGLQVFTRLLHNYQRVEMCKFPLPKVFGVNFEAQVLEPSSLAHLFHSDASQYQNLEHLALFAPTILTQWTEISRQIIPKYIKVLALVGICVPRPLLQIINSLEHLESLTLQKLAVELTEECFVNSLQRLKIISALHVSFVRPVGTQVCYIFSESLQGHKGLTHLQLTGCSVTQDDVRRVCHPAEQGQMLSFLNYLDISGNRIENAKLIGILISRSPHLHTLYCDASHIDISGIEQGLDRPHNALQSLACSANRVTSGDAMALLLLKLPSLIIFDIASCKINGKVFKHFISSLSDRNSMVQHLILAGNTIVSGICPHFAKLFLAFPHLDVLDLQSCHVDHHSFIHLLKGWSGCPGKLRHLLLGNNYLKDDSLQEFLTFIKKSQVGSSLLTLIIQGNLQISNFDYLYALWKSLPVLANLDIAQCGLDPERADDFMSKVTLLMAERGYKVKIRVDVKQIVTQSGGRVSYVNSFGEFKQTMTLDRVNQEPFVEGSKYFTVD